VCVELTPDCHTVVSSGKCRINAKNIYGPVFCDGDLEISGSFAHAFMGVVHVKNANANFPAKETFEEGKKHKSQISSTFSDFTTYRGRHSDLLNAIKTSANGVFTDNGWTSFGTTGKSFYKCPEKTSQSTCTNRKIVHIVEKSGSFSMNYKQVLQESGLGYQANFHSNTYRWCETIGSGSNMRCKQNGGSEVYADDSEGARTLVVFTNAAHVSLQSTTTDRLKWGPSVFAPNTNVKLQSEFADGQLIVKSLLADDSRTGDQLHGSCFSEPLCLW